MKEYNFDEIDGLQELVSEEFGEWSNEVEVSQSLIDSFAELSGDDYWLHTDPKKCVQHSPFKGTIAHGFLPLVLLPKIQTGQAFEVKGFNNMLNVGSDKLRFTNVVPAGSKIHSRNRVKAVIATPKGTNVIMEHQVNVAGQERPALVYEMMFMYM